MCIFAKLDRLVLMLSVSGWGSDFVPTRFMDFFYFFFICSASLSNFIVTFHMLWKYMN